MKARLMAGIMMGVLAMGAQLAHGDSTGWNVISEQDPSAALTHIRFIIRSGSLSDPAGKAGLAYFTARAMLRGTQTRPYQDLNNAIESLGGSVSVSVDGTQTVFDATVLTSNLVDFLGIMSDVFTHPAFAVSDMNLLQKILYGELRTSLQDGQTLASRAVMKVAYAGTALAHPPEGTIASVSAVTPGDAQAFFGAHYTRENMVIGITSSDPSAVIELEQQLDPIPHGALDGQQLPPPSGIQGQGVQAIVVDREGLDTVPVFVATPGIGDPDPAMLGLEAGNFVFGGDTTSRLFQVLRVQNGWTYGVYSSYQQILAPKTQPGLFSIYLYPSAKFFSPCISETLTLLQSYAAQGITASELSLAQSSLSNSYPFQLDSAINRLGWDLRSALTGRPFLTAAQYSAAVSQLNLSSVNTQIAAKTNTKDLLVVAVGDPPTLQPILAALPGVKSVKVVNVNP